MIKLFIKFSALTCALLSAVAYADSTEVWVDSYTPFEAIEAQPAAPPTNPITHYAKEVPVITLEPFIESKKISDSRAFKANNPRTLSAPLNIGVKRVVSETDTVEKVDSYLAWETLEDNSHIAALSIISPHALGNRLVLNIEKLDPRAELRFSNANNDEVFTVSGEDIINTIFKDKQTNEDQETNKNLYIGPYLSGEQATLEIFLPKKVAIDSVELSLPYLSHIFLSPTDLELLNQGSNDLSCMVNVACDSSWNNANGIARMLYTNTLGSTYVCTGTLLADRLNTREPYFLTSSGCISSQELASNLQTFWLYKTDSCYANTLNNSYKRLTGGADLLFKHDSTKTALLRLHDQAPAGVTFQGWSSEDAKNRYVSVVQYPAVAPQKVAKGYSGVSLADCQYAASGTLSCRDSHSHDAGFLKVEYNSGVTADGSNGSGMFITEKNNQGKKKHYLVGQLFTGSSSCTAPSAP
ncbi:MAG TPA: hypothetical protein VFC74_04380, partial [Oscillospiraceae bacterium]|nr:hypothetical protein [Oscillospiraceae bacterium]